MNLNTVHLICPYLRGGDYCLKCPKSEPRPYGVGQRFCYSQAKEVLDIVRKGGPFESAEANVEWRKRQV